MKEEHLDSLKMVAGIILVILLGLFISRNSSLVLALTSGFGLFGLFVASIIANATIFFPLLIEPLVFILGGSTSGLLEAAVVGLVMGAGAGIGEMTAYAIGLFGIKAIEIKNKEFKLIIELKRRIGSGGMIFIFLSALIPFPFDFIGITAGLIKYDFKKFFLAALLGKALRYTIVAVAGFYGLSFIKHIFLF